MLVVAAGGVVGVMMASRDQVAQAVRAAQGGRSTSTMLGRRAALLPCSAALQPHLSAAQQANVDVMVGRWDGSEKLLLACARIGAAAGI